jgi:hypothetical protein
MIAVTARSHANLKIGWLRGSSRASNPPPPLPIEVRPAARAMTTSLGSFARSVAREPRRAKPAVAANVAELARMALDINRCLTPMPRN